jgi:hypothetical protein
MKNKILISLGFILFLPSLVSAQDYHYVRSGAAGSNDGSDWNNAWTQLPQSLQRGHTYYIADGNYPSYVFDDTESGSQYIYIKKATQSDHGTDTGWGSGYGDGTATFSGGIAFVSDYYEMDGQVRGSDWQSGYGFKVYHGSIDLFYGGDGDSDNLIFRYVEVEGLGIDNPAHDDGIYAPVGNFNIIFSHCYLHDFGRTPILTGSADSWIIEYSYIARNSNDPYYHSEALADTNSDNFVIRHNIWADIEGTGYIIALNRGSGVGYVDNWEIYGNVFLYNYDIPFNRDGLGDGAIAVINEQIPRNWKIYNNAFINLPGLSSRITLGLEMGGGSNNVAYNNLWYDCSTANHWGVTADYNYYINTNHDSEPNEQVGSSDPFVDWINGDYHLKTPTESGFSLSSPYNVDMDSVIRGDDGVWDRGAYEYGGTVQTCTDQGYYCCPSGYICSQTRSGSGCGAGQCCASQGSCTPEPSCGDENCDPGETCLLDSCCNGQSYDPSYVCCSGSVYTGNCCDAGECASNEECKGNVCTLTCQSQNYQCCNSCQSGPHQEYDGDCTGQACCEVCYVPTQLEVTLTSPMDLYASSSNQVEFTCNALDPTDVQLISLYGNWSGWHEDETAYFANNLLGNPGFEDGFSGGLAQNWLITDDGEVGYSTSQDSGIVDSAQRIDVSSPGSWSLFLYQEPGFQLNELYTWSFWYKTQGRDEIWAEVSNPPFSEVVLLEILPGTSGEWRYENLTFRYNNTLANQLRFWTNTPGVYWFDSLLLETGQENHSFSYTSSQTSVGNVFSKTLGPGVYEWNCLGENSASETAWGEPVNRILVVEGFHRADNNPEDGCIDLNELLSFIRRWKISSKDVSMPELMEAIRLWQSDTGC